MRLRYVNAYAVTRHYGGPEEGGWWYNRGQPLASVPVKIGPPPQWVPEDGCMGRLVGYPDISAVDLQALKAERQRLRELFEDVNSGDINSVLGGVEVEVYWEDETAQPFPEETPYYC